MIRIKVYKASHLIIGALIAVLVIVLVAIAIRYAFVGSAAPTGSIRGDTKKTAALAATSGESGGVAAFAAAPSLYPTQSGSKVIQVVFEAPDNFDMDENEHTDEKNESFVIEVVPSGEKAENTKPAGETRILIYHTHTHEAYQQVASDPYVETEQWRTLDQDRSVVRVGKELAEMLRGKGFDVAHDTTDHESPELDTAYARSLETIEKYGKGAFDVYIDLHRDAYGESTHNGIMSVSLKNKNAAQLMVLLGSGDSFDEKPNFTANYQFAKALTEKINALSPNLCRDIMVKHNRYNQHVGDKAILIEVGHNLNTLEEALNSIPTLAEALCDVLMG